MPDISKAMSLTPYVPGIRLETWPEEDNKEWKDLWSRIQDEPVRERRTA
jgi:hypothetical protein